jgi:hypothetical protein
MCCIAHKICCLRHGGRVLCSWQGGNCSRSRHLRPAQRHASDLVDTGLYRGCFSNPSMNLTASQICSFANSASSRVNIIRRGEDKILRCYGREIYPEDSSLRSYMIRALLHSPAEFLNYTIFWKIWGFRGGCYEEGSLLGYKNPVRTSKETHCTSATDPSRLMLCKIWGFRGGCYEEGSLLGYKNPVCTAKETLHLCYRAQPVNAM